MIARYTRARMGRIWEEQNKYQKWLDVELAATETLAEAGIIPQDAAAVIRAKAGFDVARIDQIEAEVKHDVIAFTTSVAEHVGPAAGYFHYGLTSSDVLDTALALQTKEASGIILEDIERLLSALEKRAREFQHTLAVGRTHGIHAEPTSFGLRFALWFDEMRRHRARFAEAAETMRVGKLSGAVGTFAHLPLEIEERVMAKLGLNPAPVSTQVVQRDRHAHYLTTLALIGATLEKIAVEIRHLQRTEVREAEEYFSKGQKGSSAMPHKRNPITSEQIAGLARILRSNALAAMENVALWHERDISHSSAERVVLPDSFLAVDYMLDRFAWLVDGLVVRPERMVENVQSSHGLFFSQRLLLALVESGLARDEAYRLVQRSAMRAWDDGVEFRSLVAADAEIAGRVDLDQVFDLSAYTRHVDAVFERLRALHAAREGLRV